MFYATPWALLPPILAIVLALFTKEVYSSLFAGILLGAQTNHIEHVYTQLPYALSVAAISFVSYIVAGFYHNPLICLGVGLLLMAAFCIFMKKRMVSGRG